MREIGQKQNWKIWGSVPNPPLSTPMLPDRTNEVDSNLRRPHTKKLCEVVVLDAGSVV